MISHFSHTLDFKHKTQMAKVVALIPARSGSKGVPGKNIRELGGHPLIEWSIAACLKSTLIERTIISTDSEQYAELARRMGADVPFIRPAEISGDNSRDFEFIDHAISWLEINDSLPKYIVHIRPTTPLRDPRLIDQAINKFMNTPSSTALRSIHQMPESAYKTFEISQDGLLKRVGSESMELDIANDSRQSFPVTYVANGYIDVLSVEFIRRTGLIHGNRVEPYLTPITDEIDTEDDYSRLVYSLERSPEIMGALFKQN